MRIRLIGNRGGIDDDDDEQREKRTERGDILNVIRNIVPCYCASATFSRILQEHIIFYGSFGGVYGNFWIFLKRCVSFRRGAYLFTDWIFSVEVRIF